MGCGSSKITVVEPVKPCNGNEAETLGHVAQGGCRDDSAVSKMTTDSGVSLDAGEPTVLPGTVSRLLPPLQAQSPGLAQQSQDRPESSEILEQLAIQGIIPAQQRQGGSGESNNIMEGDEDLKHGLRTESARSCVAAPVCAEEELNPEELLPVPTRTKELQTRINGESESQRPTDSPELENDSTFQQIEDTDESF